MVQTINLTMRYGSRVLFEDINLKLDRGKRYGLIGANGAGKTTFLKILSGQLEQSSGDVVIENGLKVGVLGQNQYAFENFTLTDAVLYGNKRLYDAIKEKEDIYMSGDFSDDAVNNRLAELEIVCVEEDPTYEADVRIEKILTDLGFPVEIHQSTMSTLTNADKFKILLAQVLFPQPDVLFLDEPTNNLDISTIGWLEHQLTNHEGTMVVISHDRHFINSVVTHILDVDYRKIREFTGTYDDWYIAANLAMKQQQMEREKKLKEKADLESFIRRFSANASKAKQATSRQKQLDKLNIDDIRPSSRRDPSIVFKQNREIGKEVLELSGVSKKFDDLVIFKDLNLKIEKGDKIGLIGPNGAGKTTLCKLLMSDNVTPDSGEIKWGATVQASYFPQDTTDRIKGELTLYDWLRQFDKKAEISEIRNCLGRMLFNGEQQEKKVEGISGGEKHRIMLSKIMLEGGNFLVLDEPTNHLDLEAIVALGEGLYNFEGNAICVTHDRELLDAFANRIIEITAEGEVIDFKGTYEEYIESQGSAR